MTGTGLRIPRRFHGPADSGNGGYVCGLVARAFGGASCTVTLHQPPPLEVPLALNFDGGSAQLLDGDRLIASAVAANDLRIDVPAPPSLYEARAAEQHYAGHHRHRFPSCFTCGPEHSDGLRIFTGACGPEQVAAVWTPASDLADADGVIGSEILWAAMDCPGYWAVEQAAGLALLGRMSARAERNALVGEPLIVTGWGIASEGRKHRVGTALHDRGGEIVACATATWITLAA